MVLFAEPKLFRLELYPCFSQLCKDPHLAVRKTMAMGFHEVCYINMSTVKAVFKIVNSMFLMLSFNKYCKNHQHTHVEHGF